MQDLGPGQDTAAGPRPTDREPENVPFAYPLGTTVRSSAHENWGWALTPRPWEPNKNQQERGLLGYGAWATEGSGRDGPQGLWAADLAGDPDHCLPGVFSCPNPSWLPVAQSDIFLTSFPSPFPSRPSFLLAVCWVFNAVRAFL